MVTTRIINAVSIQAELIERTTVSTPARLGSACFGMSPAQQFVGECPVPILWILELFVQAYFLGLKNLRDSQGECNAVQSGFLVLQLWKEDFGHFADWKINLESHQSVLGEIYRVRAPLQRLLVFLRGGENKGKIIDPRHAYFNFFIYVPGSGFVLAKGEYMLVT